MCFRTNALRVPFAPENGMTVVAHGQVSVYAQQGRYQLVVDRLEPSGVGALALAVEQRKRTLAAEGLFDQRHKRALPLLPARVAVVTSRTGAALHDVVTVLGRRAPCVDVVFSSATVQGEGAAETIVAALRRAGRARGVEVVLLVRGGGSLEDLMAFNDEAVARAIRACPVPVVSGVGHETDVTIADLAADHRAATPSAAAETVAPELRPASRRTRRPAERRLRESLRREVAHKRERAQRRFSRLDSLSPALRVARMRQDLRRPRRAPARRAGHRREPAGSASSSASAAPSRSTRLRAPCRCTASASRPRSARLERRDQDGARRPAAATSRASAAGSRRCPRCGSSTAATRSPSTPPPAGW